ncbi:hypothetical protein PNA2_0345 [Pyrococcus sp. NA2]|uniref:hypothetical protein n=1 Tax=Pyrococcus sp. (strain NA2) TaxID=342949 RepID=UPI000209A909|nr:hypothetical protein [Pyrococcus sp. NA2]AEC51263.1 hypothetical protein PNA2_0345 [Pyrococcus sp. NA2]
MKVRELLKLINEAEANVKIAIVTFSSRINESPYTSLEFIQSTFRLEDELDKLRNLRREIETLDPESDINVPENLVEWLNELANFKAHLF